MNSSQTKKLFAESMKSLMETQPFSKVSISDICEKCSMNRKSFYYHFKDKYDLVNWIYYTEFIYAVSTTQKIKSWDILEEICEYFYSNRKFYANALSFFGQNSFRDYFSSLMHEVIIEYMQDAFSDLEHCGFFATFFTDAFISSITRWLTDTSPVTPENFVSLLRSSLKSAALHMASDNTL